MHYTDSSCGGRVRNFRKPISFANCFANSSNFILYFVELKIEAINEKIAVCYAGDGTTAGFLINR